MRFSKCQWFADDDVELLGQEMGRTQWRHTRCGMCQPHVEAEAGADRGEGRR